MKTWPAWPLLVLALAGCLQGDGASNGAQSAVEPLAYDVEQHFELNRPGCEGVTAILLVNSAKATKVLPPGFSAADAQQLFNGLTPTGKTPIFVSMLDCPENGTDASYGLAIVGVFVDRPQTGITNLSWANYNLYLTQAYVESKDLFDQMDALDWAVSPATMRMGLNLPSDDVDDLAGDAAARGASKILDANGELFIITSGAVTPVPSAVAPRLGIDNWVLRAWHQNEHGMGILDFSFTEDIPVGPAVCRFREHSAIAITSGYDEYCPPSDRDVENPSLDPDHPPTEKLMSGDSTMVANLPDLDVHASFHWYPGASA